MTRVSDKIYRAMRYFIINFYKQKTSTHSHTHTYIYTCIYFMFAWLIKLDYIYVWSADKYWYTATHIVVVRAPDMQSMGTGFESGVGHYPGVNGYLALASWLCNCSIDKALAPNGSSDVYSPGSWDGYGMNRSHQGLNKRSWGNIRLLIKIINLHF